MKNETAKSVRLAVESGLRAGELRSLTRGSFNLEGDEPTLKIAAYMKNRRQGLLPLRSDCAAAGDSVSLVRRPRLALPQNKD